MFLSERFGFDPIVPTDRYGDEKLALVVDWTVSALIEAEALGHNFASAQALELAHNWAARVSPREAIMARSSRARRAGPIILDRGKTTLAPLRNSQIIIIMAPARFYRRLQARLMTIRHDMDQSQICKRADHDP